MKQILILLLIGLSSSLAIAQDIIVKSNGEEIKSKVVEITIETIKYKEYEFQDGPIRNIKISDVFMIIYENGKRETFTPPGSETSQEDTTNAVSQNADSSSEAGKSYDKSDLFLLGFGLGNSYGGIGLRAQWGLGSLDDFRVHAGIGILPDVSILLSTGVKYYPVEYYYINAQFGLVGEETITKIYSYGSTSESHIVFGPSFLVGGDWVWGSKFGFGLNAGLGFTYILNAEKVFPILFAFDLGFSVGF